VIQRDTRNLSHAIVIQTSHDRRAHFSQARDSMASQSSLASRENAVTTAAKGGCHRRERTREGGHHRRERTRMPPPRENAGSPHGQRNIAILMYCMAQGSPLSLYMYINMTASHLIAKWLDAFTMRCNQHAGSTQTARAAHSPMSGYMRVPTPMLWPRARAMRSKLSPSLWNALNALSAIDSA